MQNCKPINTPIEKGYNLSLDQCPKNDEERKHMVRVPYVSAIGSMICYVVYLTLHMLRSSIGQSLPK